MKIQGNKELFGSWARKVVFALLLFIGIYAYWKESFIYLAVAPISFPILLLSYPWSGHYWVVKYDSIECYKRKKKKKEIMFSDIATFSTEKHGIKNFTIYRHNANRMPSRWDSLAFLPSEEYDKLFIPWSKWKAQQTL